ncbi:MAG: formate dehydrogenase accessory sulfurtransferase FdhD [Pseudomonadales bacterium]|nr:formate dehydrogenase accessory sulfurtransferase FdhD [Pseudomonadales bacterium]
MSEPEKSSTTVNIIKQSGATRVSFDDQLAIEEPLEIRLGYTDQRKGRTHKSISITMRTPGHDRELALGFLYAENIVSAPAQIRSMDDSRPNIVRIELEDSVALDLARLERHFYTTSSCGVCGKASLEALSMNGAQALADQSFKISAATLFTLSDTLRRQQSLFQLTGGNHAAGVFDSAGRIPLVMEDVGRHNAMDKLIGQMLLEGKLPLTQMGMVVSGRASFELMQKALMAGCPMLVAVGAPSSLAVELAQEFNVALLGFLGDQSVNIYHGAAHIL